MVGSPLLDRAGELLAHNTREARVGDRRFRFSVPSTGRYPYQWFWDSCFHAIVWSRIDALRALDELLALFEWQADSGFIPHVVFWERKRVETWHYLESRGRLDCLLPGRVPRATALVQPPILAQAVEAVVEAGGADPSELLPRLERYYRYFGRERDPDFDGLISIISRFESGLDFNPAYDRHGGALSSSPSLIAAQARLPQVVDKLLDYDLPRIFRLTRHHQEDVLVNTVYADGLQTLARLSGRCGAYDLESWAAGESRRVVERLVERCFDQRRGLFFNLDGPSEHRADRVKTILSLVPLLLADLPAEIAARLLEHLTDPHEFWAPFPVPSVALDESSFTADSRLRGRRLIWRGPCSMNTNWMIVLGLRRHGEHALARELAERSRTLIETGGFNEFFNPLDGSPVGEPHFGWATLAAVL